MKPPLGATLLCSAVAVVGCVNAHPELVDRELHLCCNLFFNQRYVATDANYGAAQNEAQPAGFALSKRSDIMLPVGTRVRIVAASDNRVNFTPAGSKAKFTLAQRFGKGPPRDYFARVFVADDPRRQLSGVAPHVLEAIRTARVVPGMTKAQVLMARGQPAPHRTASLEADEWVYYSGRTSPFTVRFVDGKVEAVTLETPSTASGGG